MKPNSTEISRRALLGAVCASPLARHPGLDPGSTFSSPASEGRKWIHDRDPLGTVWETVPPDHQVQDDEGAAESFVVTKWDRALARLAAAEAAIAAAAGAPDHVFDPIGARHHAALRRLLRTPAPDLTALARKLDLALDERTVEFDGDAAAMKTLKQDAHRLSTPSHALSHGTHRTGFAASAE